jgi:hypothetical protein
MSLEAGKKDSCLMLNNCLKFCVLNKERHNTTFGLNEFKQCLSEIDCFKKSTAHEIYTVLENAKQLFDVSIDDDKGIIVKVNIKLRVCKYYNSNSKCCYQGKADVGCLFLHLCENELKSIFGCHQANTCKLNHTFNNDLILNLLHRFKIESDPDLLCDFYKVIFQNNNTV